MSQKVGLAQISVANTNRDGTGTLGTVYTAGNNGSQVSKVEFRATGNTTEGVVRLFVYDGSNTRLVREVLVTAATPGTAVRVWGAAGQGDVTFAPALVLTAGWLLKAGTHNAETFNVITYANDL